MQNLIRAAKQIPLEHSQQIELILFRFLSYYYFVYVIFVHEQLE